MNDIDLLIADLRRYMAWDVPTDLAHKALTHAMTQLPQGAGAAWLIERAADTIRRSR